MKAILTEREVYFPKTHDLEVLLASLSPVAAEADALTLSAKALTDFAIDVRYPGGETSAAEARQALADCTAIRALIRKILELID